MSFINYFLFNMSATVIIWLPSMFLLYMNPDFFKPDSSRPFLNHLPDSGNRYSIGTSGMCVSCPTLFYGLGNSML